MAKLIKTPALSGKESSTGRMAAGLYDGPMLAAFEHVSLRYDASRPVLEDITFTLPAGGFYFLTGPSGAGKSSLLRLIYRAERPTAGRVFLFGHDTTHADRNELPALRRQIGMVFQDFRLIPHLTAQENAALPLRLAGSNEDYIERHTRELLEWVGVGARRNALPAELSGGEQQRVAIARAVVNRPKLLLADEPTGNVDDETAIKLFHLFDELNRLGTAVILATHQHNLVERFKKPALQLKAGRLISTMAKAA
ncbi:MAG: cell division ATP-binding protein FtsE [Alphaproteobacteria bacterium]|nr:cell division ATP-binding protein FtsE [Alphaproteobacteria bacterium]